MSQPKQNRLIEYQIESPPAGSPRGSPTRMPITNNCSPLNSNNFSTQMQGPNSTIKPKQNIVSTNLAPTGSIPQVTAGGPFHINPNLRYTQLSIASALSTERATGPIGLTTQGPLASSGNPRRLEGSSWAGGTGAARGSPEAAGWAEIASQGQEVRAGIMDTNNSAEQSRAALFSNIYGSKEEIMAQQTQSKEQVAAKKSNPGLENAGYGSLFKSQQFKGKLKKQTIHGQSTSATFAMTNRNSQKKVVVDSLQNSKRISSVLKDYGKFDKRNGRTIHSLAEIDDSVMSQSNRGVEVIGSQIFNETKRELPSSRQKQVKHHQTIPFIKRMPQIKNPAIHQSLTSNNADKLTQQITKYKSALGTQQHLESTTSNPKLKKALQPNATKTSSFRNDLIRDDVPHDQLLAENLIKRRKRKFASSVMDYQNLIGAQSQDMAALDRKSDQQSTTILRSKLEQEASKRKMLKQWFQGQSRTLDHASLVSLADEQRLQRMQVEAEKRKEVLLSCQFDSRQYIQQFQKKAKNGPVTQSQEFGIGMNFQSHLRLDESGVFNLPSGIEKKGRGLRAPRLTQSVMLGENTRTGFSKRALNPQQNKTAFNNRLMISEKNPFATISEALSGRGSRSLLHDKSIGSMAADSNAFAKTSARDSRSKTNDQGGQQPQSPANQEGIGSIADIDSALTTAFNISKEQLEVGAQLMDDLRKINKRYMNQRQTNRLWIIEQRNNFLRSSRQLVTELNEKYQTSRVVPELDEIRRIKGINSQSGNGFQRSEQRRQEAAAFSHQISPRVGDGGQKHEKTSRVHHYRSALHSLDQCVFDEIDDQQKQMKQNFQKYLLDDVGKNALMEKLQRFEDPEYHKVYERIRRAFRKLFVIKKGSQYVHRNRKQITAKTKKQIVREMGERREEIWRERVRRGQIMTGNKGPIDLGRAKEAQDENLRKQQLILHPKQEDVLLFNQNKTRDREVLSLPRIGEKSEEDLADQQKSQKDHAESPSRLEKIDLKQQLKKNDEQAKAKQQKTNELPSVFSRLEHSQNIPLIEGIQNAGDEFLRAQLREAEDIVEKFKQGRLSRAERKDYKKKIAEYKENEKQSIMKQKFPQTITKFEKLRDLEGMAQEELLLALLRAEAYKSCSVDISKDQKLSNLALVMSSKPTKQQQEQAEKESNYIVDQYITDLKRGNDFPGNEYLKRKGYHHQTIDSSMEKYFNREDDGIRSPAGHLTPEDQMSPLSHHKKESNRNLLESQQNDQTQGKENQQIEVINKSETFNPFDRRNHSLISGKNITKLMYKSFTTTTTESSQPEGDQQLLQQQDSNSPEDPQEQQQKMKHIMRNSFQNLTEKGKRLLMQDINQLQDSVQQMKVKKSMMLSQKVAEDKGKEASYLFFKECIQKFAPDLPIFRMILDYTFIATNYVLRPEHCQAFKKVMQMGKDCSQLFHSVHFNSNNMGDDEFAQVLEGLMNVENLQKIEYLNNRLGPKSIGLLQQLLDKPLPFQLRELALANCQMSHPETQKLLTMILKQNALQRLSLQQFTLNEGNVKVLLTYLQSNRTLLRFTLSQSKLQFVDFHKLAAVLCSSRILHEIDLSWNSFADAMLRESENDEKSIAFATLFQKQIKYNRNLMHLNLSGLGLNKAMAEIIIGSLKNTLTLVCLHMSGNPFLEELDLDEVRKLVKAMPLREKFPFIQPNDVLLAQDFKEMLINNRLQIWKRVKRTEPQINEPFMNEQLIFQRKLGHKDELPGIGQWEVLSGKERPLPNKPPDDPRCNPVNQSRQLNDELMKNECWNCSNHSYTLVFWSHSIWQMICIKFAELQKMHAINYAQHLLKGSEVKSAIFKPSQYRPVPFFKGFVSQSSTLSKVSEDNVLDEQQEDVDEEALQNMNISKLITPVISDPQPRRLEDPPFGRRQRDLVLIQDSLEELSKTSKFQLQPKIRYTLDQVQDQEEQEDQEPEFVELDSLSKENQIQGVPISKQISLPRMDDRHPGAQALPKQTDSGALFEAAPRVFSQYSDWQPVEMFDLFDFCHLLEDRTSDPPTDFIQILKDKGKIPSGIENVDELDPIQTQWLYQEQQIHENEFRRRWADQIIKHSRFKQANVVNFELAQQAVKRGEQVWVAPMFMRPGKQSLFFHHPQSYANQRVAVQTCLINVRQERVPHFEKSLNKESKNQGFNLEGSVFAQWRDNNRLFEQHDFSKWKIDRFVKRPHEQRLIRQFFLDNIQIMKEIYANMQAISSLYPGISGSAFSEFCQMAGLIDKQFSLSTADRLFIAANYDVNDDAGDNSQNELIRYELLEILARVAKTKYLDTGLCQNVAEGLQLLLDQIMADCPLIPWASWRQSQLWTTDVNNLYFVNLEPLRKLFGVIGRKPKPKRVSYDNFHHFFVSSRDQAHYEIKILDRQFRKCYAFCKIPVLNEDHELDLYNSLIFVEFLEFLGRLAEIKYRDKPIIQEEPLVNRLGYLLDALFEIIGEYRRESYDVKADETVSDDDY